MRRKRAPAAPGAYSPRTQGMPGAGPQRERPQTRKGLPKVCSEPLTVRLLLGRDACKHTHLGTPSRRTPLDTRILPRRVARAAAILEVAAIPDADARGRARVAAPRWVREQRPGRGRRGRRGAGAGRGADAQQKDVARFVYLEERLHLN